MNLLSLVYFTFGVIKTEMNKEGKEEKKLCLPRGWQKLKDSLIKENSNSIGILTGNVNGITVIDFDNIELYEYYSNKYEKLRDYKTVRTNKGYHVYCKYDDKVNTGTNVLKEMEGMDIRNDGGFVIGPPTKYKLKDGIEIEYKDMGGEILEFPEIILKDIKTENKSNIKKSKNNKKELKKDIIIDEKLDSKEIEEYELILKSLSKNRVEEYDNWLKIGMILKTELGYNTGYKLWNKWSKLSEKYDESIMDRKWESFKLNGGLTSMTLLMYLREDNIDIFMSICFKEIDIKDLNNLNHTTFSDIFMRIYGKDLLRLEERFYNFNGVYWKIDDSESNSVIINNLISGEFHTFMIRYLLHNKEKEENYDKKFQVINQLRNSRYIRDVIDRIKYHNSFNRELKLDENINLIAFENKVYDFKTGEIRDGLREDYISMSVGYNWIEPCDKEMRLVEDLFEKLFVNEEERRLFCEILYTSLLGMVPQYFTLANGVGSNGKSLLLEVIMKKVLGIFYYKANNSTLQDELKAGPNVEIAQMHKKRLIIYSEPNKSKTLNTDVIKNLTGGIETNARMNYSNKTECQLHGTHILLCNKKPLLNDTDGGTSRRIIDFPFRSLFVNEDDKENYKDIDNVYTRVSEYSEPEFWNEYRCAIFKYLLRYKIKGDIKIPDNIKERSKEYLCDSDYILSWMKDNYEECIYEITNEKNVIKISEIYEIFKDSDYYKNSDRKKKRELSDSNFIQTLSTHYKYKKNYIEEYRYYDENKNRKKIRNVLKNLRKIDNKDE